MCSAAQLPSTNRYLIEKKRERVKTKHITMNSTAIDIPTEDSNVQKSKSYFHSYVTSLMERACTHDMKKLIHSIKVGIALVLVSLLYLLDPLFNQVGKNAMWAIMTVVVVFEFYAGAMLSKGLNRGVGTILGGGLGCLAAMLADEYGGTGNAIVVGISVFIFGAAATYFRLIPKIKRRYDYGAMIFILTFSLVVVSGVRADKIMHLARQRLSTVGMGFSVCIFTSLLIFPIWASDELHNSTASKFGKLAECIEGCLEEYFIMSEETEKKPSANVSSCKSSLNTKSTEEALANFAKWEPWHGKFGFNYPWERYLRIGEVLRELAATIISLKGCIESPKQPPLKTREDIKEPCKIVGLKLVQILKELGDSIIKMKRCHAMIMILPKLQSMKLELSIIKPPKHEEPHSGEGIAIASFMFLLMEILEKVEVLAKEVEELGKRGNFQIK